MTNKTAYAVIGANFGDEAKGLTTDYLCSKAKGPVTVIRFSGGAQAGHTVQAPDGLRHVFHHFSSGSFLGAKTYLSQHFICNPILFHEERTKLLGKGVPEVGVLADPRCIVTTPWDMMLNRLTETKRGVNRHGSCGIGINETVTRNAETTYGLTLDRVRNDSSLKVFLQEIQQKYVPYRLEQLEIPLTSLSGQEKENLFSKGILEHYFEDLHKFDGVVSQVKPEVLSGLMDSCIFEGAQGLGLDEKRGRFPYVTRASTGLQNVVDLCPALGIEEIKAVYVTRPYITRHGQGPVSRELSAVPWAVVDLTNIPNKWQGMLRFGWLDETELSDRITLDLADARYKIMGSDNTKLQIKPTVMLSCVDQLPGSLEDGLITFYREGKAERKSVGGFLQIVRSHINSPPEEPCLVSLGPTRASVLPLIDSRAPLELENN